VYNADFNNVGVSSKLKPSACFGNHPKNSETFVRPSKNIQRSFGSLFEWEKLLEIRKVTKKVPSKSRKALHRANTNSEISEIRNLYIRGFQ